MASTIIAEFSECPVCFERLQPPVQACKRGHPICKICRKTVTICPTCRGDFPNFSSFRSSSLDLPLIEVAPALCRYKKMGCDTELPLDELNLHEAVCDYRPVSCIWHLQCGKQDVVFCQYNNHLKEVHALYTKKMKLNEKMAVTVKTKTDAPMKASIILSDERNQLFFIRRSCIDLQQNRFFVTMHYIGNSENAKKYIFKIKIDQGLHSSHKAYYTYTSYCLPYIESCVTTTAYPRVVTLDTRKIFLTDKHLSEINYFVTIERVAENQ